MENKPDQALGYAHNHSNDYLDALKSLLTIPSVSTLPDHREYCHQAANLLTEDMKHIGIAHVQAYPTPGNPIVYGDILEAGPEKPTILLYGHYDVQPPDPLELWETPPFQPEKRGDNLYARGASDMKGQIMAFLNAVEAVKQTGKFPINLKFIIEGEEESGSRNLAPFIREYQTLLASDIALNLDASMAGMDTPSITYALRGMSYFELLIEGPDHDLHSGSFGGVIHNPANALCKLIAGMHDENGRITLPGFYDGVRPLEQEERRELARQSSNPQRLLDQTGAPALWGEKEFTPIERMGARPTLDVNGMISGYTGTGGKTIIPSWARAKVSMRLVPDQDPNEVTNQLRQYLSENAPATIRWTLFPFGGAPACITDRSSVTVSAFSSAQKAVWGISPIFKREGGSIPVVSMMQDILGIDSLLSGFGLPDDHIHSPNEKLHLPTWYKGIDTLIYFFYNLA